MPNTMPTPCMAALRSVATSSNRTAIKRSKAIVLSPQVEIYRNRAKPLMFLRLTIRNQQVAGSIPAGGSSLFNFLVAFLK